MLLGYTRVSTTEQAEDNRTSLAEQERIISGLAMVRGIDKMDTAIYSDPGVSGSIPMCRRPSGSKLLDDMKSGDLVVASKLDRMFRSASDALNCAETMKTMGVGLILMDMGADPVTENGMSKAFFTMAAAFAELERSTINERMSNGKRAKLARGGHAGGLPRYGTRVVGSGRDATRAVNEDEQKIIELVRDLRKRGNGLHRICSELTAAGHKTRTGRDFQAVQVMRMLGE